ncbi:MAG: EF-hand domain-containing protein [archaeon]|nr:EF-hand domain-containing protein [archaeon]
MLSVETSNLLFQYIVTVLDYQKKLDFFRQEINNLIEFDPYAIFYRMDYLHKNYLNDNDFLIYFKEKLIYPTNEDIRHLIKWYDYNFDGLLSYGEFIYLIMADKSRNLLPPFTSNANMNENMLSFQVENLLFAIISLEIEFCRESTKRVTQIKERFDFSIPKIMNALGGKEYISKENLRNYWMMKTGNILEEEEMDLLMNRLDIQKSGKLTVKDICNIFLLKKKPMNKNTKENKKITNRFNTYGNNTASGINTYRNNTEEGINNTQQNMNINTTEEDIPEDNIKLSMNPNINNIDSNPSALQNTNRSMNSANSNSLRDNSKIISSTKLRSGNPPPTKNSLSLMNSKTQCKTQRSKGSSLNDFNNIKFNTSAKPLIINLFEMILQTEIQLEEIKINLSLRNDFHPEVGFRFFEYSIKKNNLLDEVDLFSGLNSLGIFPTGDEVRMLIKRYSLMGDNKLNYADFFDMVIPFNKKFREMIEKKDPSIYFEQPTKSEMFLGTTKKMLADIFEKIILSENKIEIIRKRLSIFNDDSIREVFEGTTIDKKDLMNHFEFRQFLRENIKGSRLEDKDCDLCFLRFDTNRDAFITFENILKECRTIRK